MDDPRCPNCGMPSGERFCSACGQRQGPDLIPTVRNWARDVLDELLFVDARLPKTLRALFWPPGYLTEEWWKGRRAAYVAPLRLYLLVAIPFFFGLAIISMREEVRDDTFPPFIIWMAYLRYELEDVQLNERMEPLPAELRDDTAAWANWRTEALRRQAENDSVWAALNRGAGASIRRIFDLLPIAVGVTMIPLLAVLLGIGFGTGQKRPFVARLVMSLHLHTVGYALAGVGSLVGLGTLTGLGGGAVYLGVALQRLDGGAPAEAVLKAMVVPIAYSLGFLGLMAGLLRGIVIIAPTWLFGA